MLESRHRDRWSDADLDRALVDLLAKSPVDPASLDRVQALIGSSSGHAIDVPGTSRPAPAGTQLARSRRGSGRRRADHASRHRAALLVAAAALAAAAAVTVPLALIRPAAAPLTANTTAPLSPAACLRHNLTAQQAVPTPAAGVIGPGASPATNWYSAAKAAQLNMALESALPAGTCVFQGSAWGGLTFPDRLNPGNVIPQVGMLDAQAAGRLVTPAGDGDLSVSIFHAADAKSCVPERFDRTLTEKDGTVIWQLTGSATSTTTRWIVLWVTAFQKNGTCSVLRVSDERLGADGTPPRPGMTATGSPPLTLTQLTALATAPGLTITGASDSLSGTALFTFPAEAGRTEFSYPARERRELPLLAGPDLTGTTTLRTSDYAGKVVVINFWASWCAPCRAEAAQLRAASTSLNPADVQFLGIDVKDTTAAARIFDSTSRIAYPSIFDPAAQTWQAISGGPMNALPVTIVLDRGHRVAHVWAQEITQAALTAVVGALIKEK